MTSVSVFPSLVFRLYAAMEFDDSSYDSASSSTVLYEKYCLERNIAMDLSRNTVASSVSGECYITSYEIISVYLVLLFFIG